MRSSGSARRPNGPPTNRRSDMHSSFAAIGRFAVRFRWIVVAAWIAATVLATLMFPSLSSVEKDNNTTFLPANVPSVRAFKLAAAFENANQTPIPVVIAGDSGALGNTDLAAVGRLAPLLLKVSSVQQVRNLGVSRDGEAAQLLVLAHVNINANAAVDQVVASLRRAISAAGLPAGLHAHLAGRLAAQADVDKNGQQGVNLGLDLSILFILVLLIVVFRAVLAPLLTLAPAVLVTALAGPVIGEASKAGVQVSSLTQIMLLILTLGAGTDYGLFLVFRVREELRSGQSPHDAVVRALSRVGESVTFSAATVIAALLTLLLATFGLYSSLGLPLAIAIGLMLLAGLTLLPALLAIFGRAAFWPSRTTASTERLGWWGRTAGRIVARPAATLVLGVVIFGALAAAAIGYRPGTF